jgi:4-hydroxyphenylpyruvate dioxygenase
MKEWADFYERLFNFREIRYFDIEGKVTGVKSKAMTSPCGKIRIPINEEGDEKQGQIQEYLDSTTAKASSTSRWAPDDIFATVEACARPASHSWTRRTPTTS